jgi:ankyrin repeat protein
MDVVELCLSRGAHVNTADTQSCTPLMVAARLGNLGALKALLSKGARLEAAGTVNVASVQKGAGTCVQLAAAYNHLPVLQ